MNNGILRNWAQKISFSAMLLLSLATSAQANPEDGNVVGGSATITASPGEVQINQASDRALIEWGSFNIGAGETTRFIQPGAASIALNRVVNSSQISTINGNLIANGNVILINPNGVLIGAGGRVDTAGFIATSADIGNDAFMNGTNQFDFSIAGKPDAVVENQGRITVAETGLAALVAPYVRNSGLIQGNMARIQLAAADTFAVDFYGDGLISFAVESPTDGSKRTISVENTGSLIADGGKVLMTAAAASNVVDSVINNTGIIQAQSLISRNGEIILTGAGAKVSVAGKIDVSAKLGTSGGKNGGSIKIGGDYQGGGDLAHSATTLIVSDAILLADAGTQGDGGQIVVWSNEATGAHGLFYARGGSESGNGGLIETSSAGVLGVDGAYVNTLAANGSAGDWLLDPATINIKTSGVSYVGLPAGGTSDVNVATINAALSNVTLSATTAVNFQADVNIAAAGVNFSVISGTAGFVPGFTVGGLVSGSGTISSAGHFIRTNGGSVSLTSGDTISLNNSTIYTRGGNVTLLSGDITINNSSAISTRGGNVNMTAIDAFGTSGDISTNSAHIDTTSPTAPGIGGITLIKNGAALPQGSYGNPANVFVQSANGGSVTINGKTIGGNSVCFAAGGPGCVVADPVPATAIVISADALSKIYGNADPLFTYTYTGTLTTGDSFSGALTRAAGENVGTYSITQGALTIVGGFGNYTITYNSALLTITKAPLTVVANAQTKVYGSADPTLTYTASGLKLADTAGTVLSGTLSRIAGENVATSPYTITQGSLASNGNYSVTYTSNLLTITPATLTVAADAKTKVYGAADPTLTYASSGFKFADTAGSVLTGGLTRVAGENVATSPYSILQGTLASNSNYTIAYTGNNLTITPATLTVAANAQTKVYGSADPTLTYASSGFKFADTAGSVLTGGLTRVAGENVATSPYSILQGSLAANSNYTIAYSGNTLTITPATLTVAADAQTKVYGSADPTLTFASSGFKFADTAGSVLTGGLTRVAGEHVALSPYAILQGTLASNSNYTIAYTGNNLTITPATLTVAADAQTKIYGAADPALTYAASGFQLGDAAAAVLSGGLDRDPGETVVGGPYAINLGTLVSNSDYTIAYTGNNLTITPARLAVLADAQTKVYGSADPALTYAASGFQFTDTAASVLSGDLTRVAGEHVAGSPYAILQGTLTADSNYTLVYFGNDLTITPATLTVAADAQTKVYGSADPTLTYASSGFQFTDTAASVLSGDLTRAVGEHVIGSPYAILQGTLASNSDYTIAYTGNDLTITPATLTVAADAQTKVYGAADPTLTYASSGFQFTDTAGSVLTGGLDRDPGETVVGGPYAINQGTLLSNTDYTIAYTGNNLTITPATLTVAADAQSKVYGSADPTLTYASSGFQFTDTAASVLTGGLNRAAGETVLGGPYAINQGSLDAGSNYTIAYTGNNLIITPYVLGVLADAQTKVYGSADPTLTYTFGTLQNKDTASVFTGGLTRTAGENVVGSPYFIAQGSLSAGSNYLIDYIGNAFTITPYSLTVTADAQVKQVNTPDPGLTYTFAALQNGDSASVFTGALERIAGETVAGGPYAINRSSLDAGSNYVLVYIGNVLTILPAPVVAAAPTPAIPLFEVDALGRPIISYDDKVIVQNLPFKAYETATTDTDVSIKAPDTTPGGFNAIEPAAGGSPSDLNNLEPAAGGPGSGSGSTGNSDVACGNNFLDNKPCTQQ